MRDGKCFQPLHGDIAVQHALPARFGRPPPPPSTVGDHFVPVAHFVDLVEQGILSLQEARGEANDPANIFGLCTLCNGKKTDKWSALKPVPGFRFFVPDNPSTRLYWKVRAMERGDWEGVG